MAPFHKRTQRKSMKPNIENEIENYPLILEGHEDNSIQILLQHIGHHARIHHRHALEGVFGWLLGSLGQYPILLIAECCSSHLEGVLRNQFMQLGQYLRFLINISKCNILNQYLSINSCNWVLDVTFGVDFLLSRYYAK